ncbi:unnamed protein product [Microthlaspi erraticum]|uniref:Uncharacterized protein n=1 Tax=Microthlaspi erraticum TaxID=1685480 RepID=A0A6D2LBL9_9BRAS|nr:unnamed protein product [Microthlaspi erraticum]
MWRVQRGEDDWALVTLLENKSKTQESTRRQWRRKLGLSKLFKLECSEYSLQGVPLHSSSCLSQQQWRPTSCHSLCAPPHLHHFQCKQEANKVTTDEFYILTTPFIKHEYKANLGLLFAKTLINVRNLAQDLEGNKKLCQIHFLNRWTQNPTKFCYEFPIGPTNTSLVLLPHEDIPSLRSGVVTFQPKEEDFYVPSSEKPSFPILTYRTLQRTVKLNAATKNAMFSPLAWRTKL